MKRFMVPAVGLALVVGFIIGGIVINPFDGTASAAPPDKGGGVCYTNWNDDTCAPGWTAVSTGLWTWYQRTPTEGSPLLCVRALDPDAATFDVGLWVDQYIGDGQAALPQNLPCAICCN
jgi:hypothetical protein